MDIAGFVTADGRAIEVLGQWGPTARELREEQERSWAAAQDAKAAVKEAEKQAAEAVRAAATAQRGAERASKRDQAKADALRLKEEAERKKQEAERKKDEAAEREAAWRKSLTRSAEFQRLGRGTDGAGEPARTRRSDRERTADTRAFTAAAVGKDAGPVLVSPEAAFLRRLHKGACATFGTVLGPDANEAHRNHFHFDLAPRKHSAFCE
ncbi:MAG: extensin family protein [Hyphomicrobiaceae bacterium]|nr:extensin family protein [Hyphomicrobiaceae bacterium]